MTDSAAAPLTFLSHGLRDYQQMFSLTAVDFDKLILDCYPGPASFSAELSLQQHHVVAVDDIYTMTPVVLTNYVRQQFDAIISELQHAPEQIVWREQSSLASLQDKHELQLERFIADFTQGKQQQRYLAAPIEQLPFDDSEFELALCAHYLFGQRVGQELATTHQIIEELLRVAAEVRIFPLVDRNGDISPFLGPVMLRLQEQGHGVEIRVVPYELQKNGNAMLCIKAHTCRV